MYLLGGKTMICFPFGINRLLLACVALFCSFYISPILAATDLDKAKSTEVIGHPAILQADFVPSAESGSNAKLMRRFATYLEVKYQYAQKTDWPQKVSEPTEKKDQIREAERADISAVSDRSDTIVNSMVTLSWRQKASRLASPIFPTQEWLIELCSCASDLNRCLIN